MQAYHSTFGGAARKRDAVLSKKATGDCGQAGLCNRLELCWFTGIYNNSAVAICKWGKAVALFADAKQNPRSYINAPKAFAVCDDYFSGLTAHSGMTAPNQ